MRIEAALLLLAVGWTSCSPGSEGSDTEESSSEVNNFCPPVPPTFANIEITRAIPAILGAGQVVTIEGRNFDQLPANTVAWFYADGNSFTATSELFVLDSSHARAVVPSHNLVRGRGLVSLFYTDCVDCSSQGGGPNSCTGIWVNPRTLKPVVEFTHPTPSPLPVSNLTAVAVSDTQVRLTWDDNSNNEDYFEIFQGNARANTTQSISRVGRNQTGETIFSLSASTLYCFEVRAVNRSGTTLVPPEAKSCVTTPLPSGDFGSVTIASLGGFENTLCPGTQSHVPLFAFQDSDRNGVVRAFGAPALADPGPAWVLPNVDNTPAWNVYIANGYAAGANMVVLANISSCGASDPQFVALHMYWDGGSNVRPLFYLAGNYRERTGPRNEYFGTVMITDELAGMIQYDAPTKKVRGSIRATVFFHVEIPNTGIAFDSAADVTLDFSRGVEVVRE